MPSMSSDEKQRRATEQQVPHNTLMTLGALRRVPGSFSRPPPRPVGAAPISLDPLKIVPDFHISLSDALDGRHLPPLSLKDFEQYLCFEGRSPENLYFTLWFRDYKAHFEQWQPPATEEEEGKPRDEHFPPEHLIQTFTRAKSTFLEAGSNFELDVPSEKRRSILKSHLPPHPSAFEDVNAEVEAYLQDAFSTFVIRSHQNISTRYRITGFSLGVLQILASFLPLLIGLYYHQSRWIRLAGWPLLASGIGFLYCSGIGVCPVIYSLSNGEMRQIRPYEQCQNDLCLDLARTISTVSTESQPKHSGIEVDLEAQTDGTDNEGEGAPGLDLVAMAAANPALASGSRSSVRRFASTFIRPYSVSSSLRARRNSASANSDHNHQHPPSSSDPTSPTTFDFDGLPNVTLPKAQPSTALATATAMRRPLDLPANFFIRDVPCFGPLTKVLSDIVRRLQWEIIVRSAVMDVTLATLITIAVMFIPEL